jgi:hypothetical protein
MRLGQPGCEPLWRFSQAVQQFSTGSKTGLKVALKSSSASRKKSPCLVEGIGKTQMHDLKIDRERHCLQCAHNCITFFWECRYFILADWLLESPHNA